MSKAACSHQDTDDRPLLERTRDQPAARSVARHGHWPGLDRQARPLLELPPADDADRMMPELVTTPKDPRCQACSVTTTVGLSVALAYSLSYFWRYPVFILPKHVLAQHVTTVGGKPLDLQACLSRACCVACSLLRPSSRSWRMSGVSLTSGSRPPRVRPTITW